MLTGAAREPRLLEVTVALAAVALVQARLAADEAAARADVAARARRRLRRRALRRDGRRARRPGRSASSRPATTCPPPRVPRPVAPGAAGLRVVGRRPRGRPRRHRARRQPPPRGRRDRPRRRALAGRADRRRRSARTARSRSSTRAATRRAEEAATALLAAVHVVRGAAARAARRARAHRLTPHPLLLRGAAAWEAAARRMGARGFGGASCVVVALLAATPCAAVAAPGCGRVSSRLTAAGRRPRSRTGAADVDERRPRAGRRLRARRRRRGRALADRARHGRERGRRRRARGLAAGLGDRATPAALPTTRAVMPVLPGVVAGGTFTSQGDAAHRAPQARAAGATGAGVTVGVISDSMNEVSGGVAASQGRGDLPADVEVLSDDATGEDEGRAMSEIVYDLAPGVSRILFGAGAARPGRQGQHDRPDGRARREGDRRRHGLLRRAVLPGRRDRAGGRPRALARRRSTSPPPAIEARQSWESDVPGGPERLRRLRPRRGDTTSPRRIVERAGGEDDHGRARSGTSRGARRSTDIDARARRTSPILRRRSTPTATTTTSPPDIPLAAVSWTNTGPARRSRVGLADRAATQGTRTPLHQVHRAQRLRCPSRSPSTATNSPAPSLPTPRRRAVHCRLPRCAGAWRASTPVESFSSRGPVTRLFDRTGVRLAAPDVRAKPELAAADGVTDRRAGLRDRSWARAPRRRTRPGSPRWPGRCGPGCPRTRSPRSSRRRRRRARSRPTAAPASRSPTARSTARSRARRWPRPTGTT